MQDNAKKLTEKLQQQKLEKAEYKIREEEVRITASVMLTQMEIRIINAVLPLKSLLLVINIECNFVFNDLVL